MNWQELKSVVHFVWHRMETTPHSWVHFVIWSLFCWYKYYLGSKMERPSARDTIQQSIICFEMLLLSLDTLFLKTLKAVTPVTSQGANWHKKIPAWRRKLKGFVKDWRDQQGVKPLKTLILTMQSYQRWPNATWVQIIFSIEMSNTKSCWATIIWEKDMPRKITLQQSLYGMHICSHPSY